ncbi:atp-dependent helicase [Salix suchowensis]|nr:atp-dependent helicase [Salix suchowensis]
MRLQSEGFQSSQTSIVPAATMQADIPKATFPHNVDYYFSNVIFLVGNELFNVPRHKFQSESVIFRSMFDLPTGDKTPDGLTDEQPLRLDGIDRDEFSSLLEYLYPRGIERPLRLTLAEWLAVLKQSTRWEMDRIRNDAIETIPTLVADPAQWLGLAIDYNVEAWFIPAMNKLVQRAEPLSTADLAHIGIECVLKIAAIREVCHSKHASVANSYIFPHAVRGPVTYNCDDRIGQEFKDHLTTPLLSTDKALTAVYLNPPASPSPKEANFAREEEKGGIFSQPNCGSEYQ